MGSSGADGVFFGSSLAPSTPFLGVLPRRKRSQGLAKQLRFRGIPDAICWRTMLNVRGKR